MRVPSDIFVETVPIEFLYFFLYNQKYRKECLLMLAVNYTTYRKNLKNYCDRAIDDDETVIVTRKNERNVVMMGLDAYNNLMENLFITRDRKNYQHILKGIHELEAGHTVQKSSKDLEKLLDE